MLDTIIITGILISGGLMALLPIIKDPLNREKETKWLIGKFNWVAYAIIFLFIISVLLGLWKEKRDKDDKINEIKENSKELSKYFEKVITYNNEELSSTKKYIVDSMTGIYNKEGNRQEVQLDSVEARRKRQMDSLEANRQRSLTNIDKLRLIKRLNDFIKANNLPQTAPILVGGTMGNEEARLFAHQVHDFLKLKGYNIIYLSNGVGDGVIAYTIGQEKDFLIKYDETSKYISIHVGVLGNKP